MSTFISTEVHARVVDGLLALWDVMVNVHLQDIRRKRCSFQHTLGMSLGIHVCIALDILMFLPTFMFLQNELS